MPSTRKLKDGILEYSIILIKKTMGRNIKLPEIPLPKGPPHDDYSAQILKLLPADLVGLYLGIQSLVAGLVDRTSDCCHLGQFPSVGPLDTY